MENEEMSELGLKTFLEMIILILEGCENIEGAREKISSLSILK